LASWKLDNEKGIWQDIVKAKYFRGGMLSYVKHRIDDFPVWAVRLGVRCVYLRGRKVKVNNGKKALFWEDPLLNDKPLFITAPVLYDLCNEKFITVYQVLSASGQLTFRHWLPPILFEMCMKILEDVYSYDFDNVADPVTWKWCKDGSFSTKSVYNHLASGDVGVKFTHIWKAKLPYKIKIFCWLVEEGAILTKDNMVKRNWPGDPTCCFCHESETINHLFFQCAVAKVIWGIVGLCSGVTNILRTSSNIGPGCRPGYQGVLQFTFSAWPLCAGQYGSAEIKRALKTKN
jgi:hypothetical protein